MSLVTHDECFDDTSVGSVVFVNTDMSAFVASYSTYMSRVFALRAQVTVEGLVPVPAASHEQSWRADRRAEQ